MTEEQSTLIEEAMLQFVEAHSMLAKSGLKMEEYNPISFKLADGKLKLFTAWQQMKKEKASNKPT